jgi:hypothetical protein
MAQKRVCRDFMENPKKDPIDGHRLIPGKGPYKGYIAMCLENDFNVAYMLDEDFINELSSKSKRSTSPARSPRNITIPRSPKTSSLPLRSQPTLPRSIPSATRPDSLPMRSYSDGRLNGLASQTTQTLYPRVTGPSVTQVPVSTPVQSVARVPLPTPVARSIIPSYTERSEVIGRERFDPDPITTVTKIPGSSVRKTVQGPYGPNGENILISGVHKLPGQMVYSTADIPEHEVRSVHSGYNRSVVNTLPPVVNNNGYNRTVNTLPPVVNNNGYNRTVNTLPPVVNTSANRVLYPLPAYNARTEQIGNETFDPDPITKVSEIPPRSVRTAVRGPYGANGENVVTTGVYTAPGRRVYSTIDVPEHEVRSIPRPMNNSQF